MTLFNSFKLFELWATGNDLNKLHNSIIKLIKSFKLWFAVNHLNNLVLNDLTCLNYWNTLII